MIKLLFILILMVLRCEAISFAWNAASQVDGYSVYVSGTNIYRFDAGTNLTASVPVPPGFWTTWVCAYSTNNSNEVAVESAPSNEVRFYVPESPTGNQTLNVDRPFEVQNYALASNAVLRVIPHLQVTRDFVTWSEFVPLLGFDVNDGTNAFYRVRLESVRIER
jgi:hypothetical protein